MTFPAYQDTTGSNQGTYSTTHNVTLPATKTADDVWLMAWAMSGSGGTVTGPSGWTEVLAFDLNANQKFRIWIYRSDGTETGTATVTTSLNNRSAAIIRRYSDVSTEDLADVFTASAGVYAFTDTPDPPSVSASWGSADNTFVPFACHCGRGEDFTAYPASYSNGVAEEEATIVGVAGADRQLASVSDDPGTFTIAGDENTAAATVVLKPVLGPVVAEADTGTATDNVLAELVSNPRPADSGNAGDTIGVDLRLAVPEVEFPQTTLDVRIELWLQEQWVDVSDRLIAQQLAPARGRADESSETEPGSLTVTLWNADGHLTPRNGNSPWFPEVDVGMLTRLSVRGGGHSLILPGGNSWAETPTDPSYAVTDLDLRVRVDPTVWTKDTDQRFVTRWDFNTGNRCWNFGVRNDGLAFLTWSPDGLNSNTISRTTFPSTAALRPIWLGVTLDANNGVGGYTASWYRSDDVSPPADITTWALIEQKETTSGTTQVHTGPSPIVVGAIKDTSQPERNFDGRILAFQHRSSINGPTLIDVDFTSTEIGSKAFIDSSGKSWALSSGAEITNWRPRFVGTADELVATWPYGDNQPSDPEDLAGETITLWGPADVRASDHRATLTVNGILRRLGQGSDPIRSSLYRHITGSSFADNVAAYWSMEENEGAARFSAGLTTHDDMTVDGPIKIATDDSLVASAPLPVVEQDDVVTLTGVVPDIGADSDWSVDWFTYIETPETNPTTTEIMAVRSAGGIATWRVSVSSTVVNVDGFTPGGSSVISSSIGVSASSFYDRWLLWRLRATQDGADVDWSCTVVFVDGGGAVSVGSGTVSSTTLGRVTSINPRVTGPPDGITFGHVIVNTNALGWLAGADTAWVGEAATHRFARLCDEDGIAVEIIGDSTLWELRGDLSVSEPMGPQERKTLSELLNQCAALDGGIVIERRGAPGLIYRSRASLENQPVRMSLDGRNNDIVNPLVPVSDDQGLVNDVTVSATFGTSARVFDSDSIEARRRYRDAPELAGVGGVLIQEVIILDQDGLKEAQVRQNLDLASWRVHLGTWQSLRYPTLVIPLDIVLDQVDDWLDLAIGDRIQLVNLPAQHPDEIVDLIVQHVTETMEPTLWRPELTCRPGGPWIIGELG